MVNEIYTGGGPVIFYHQVEVGQGGALKADNRLRVGAVAILAENDKRVVLNDPHFTTLSKEKKSYVSQMIGKESIQIYANDIIYGSGVRYSLYSYKKVRASTIRKQIEAAIKAKYGFLVTGLNLDCIMDPEAAA